MPRLGKDEGMEPSGWEKAQIIASVISSIAIPILVLVAGLLIQNAISRRSTATEYVALATQILSSSSKTMAPLRSWAVALLEQYSPLPIPEEAAGQLRSGRIIIQPPPLVIVRAASGSIDA